MSEGCPFSFPPLLHYTVPWGVGINSPWACHPCLAQRQWLGSPQPGGGGIALTVLTTSKFGWGVGLLLFSLCRALYILMLEAFSSQVLELLTLLSQQSCLCLQFYFSYLGWLCSYLFFTARSHSIAIFSDLWVKVRQLCCICWPWTTDSWTLETMTSRMKTRN